MNDIHISLSALLFSKGLYSTMKENAFINVIRGSWCTLTDVTNLEKENVEIQYFSK